MVQGWRVRQVTRLLGVQGRSAGGLTMGAVLNMRPDLFNAAIMGVPFVDVVTTMMDESIPLTNIEQEEWGNPNVSCHVARALSCTTDTVCHSMYCLSGSHRCTDAAALLALRQSAWPHSSCTSKQPVAPCSAGSQMLSSDM